MKATSQTRMVSIRLTEEEIGALKAKARLAGETVTDFIRETAIYGKQEFTLSKLPGGERVDVKEALEGLLDTEHRTVQKHFNVTPYEDTFIRSAAKKAGMTQSRFMVDRILHTPMYYIGDPDFFQKFFYELNKQGVNLNQLMKFCNTYGLDAFNESHVIPTLENERTVFLQTKAALLSLEEEARRGNVMVNLELSDDMEEEDS